MIDCKGCDGSGQNEIEIISWGEMSYYMEDCEKCNRKEDDRANEDNGI